jgi:hypothetical protein
MAYSAPAVATRNEAHLLRDARQNKNAGLSREVTGNETLNDHLQTYRGFVRGVTIFAVHALAILILLYYFLM